MFNDIVPFQELLKGITNAYILADKVYFSEENKNKPVIPAKENYTKGHNIDGLFIPTPPYINLSSELKDI